METQIHENEDKMVQPEFWNDPEEAQKVIDSNNHLKKIVDGFNDLKDSIDDIEVSLELLKEEDDEGMRKLLDKKVKEPKGSLVKMELITLSIMRTDNWNPVLNLHPEAVGPKLRTW